MLKQGLVVLLAALLGACSSGGSVDRGTATGRVYVGDRSYELRHACAYAPPGGEELWVYLTDVPLSEDQVIDRFGVHDAARADRVHGVKLLLDPTVSDPKELHAVLLMPPESEDASLASISASGSTSRFERLSLPPAAIAGQVRYAQEAIFDSPPYGFEAEFQIAGGPAGSAVEPVTLTGAAAQASPQAEVFLAGEAAILSGDLDAAARYMASGRIDAMRQFKEQASPEEFEAMLEQQRQRTAQGDERRKQISEVIVEGDEAVLSTTTGERVQLHESEGRWIAR